MRVFTSVGVGVGVVVLDMLVVVAGVRVRVSEGVVLAGVGGCAVCRDRLYGLSLSSPVGRDPDRIHCALRDEPWEQLTPILSGPQPSRRLRCRTVRMGLRWQGSGTRVN